MADAIARRSDAIDHSTMAARVAGGRVSCQTHSALGLAGPEAGVVRRQHARGRLIGERARRLRRDVRPEQGAEERQAIDAHHPTHQVRMLLGQQHRGHPAHRMPDDRRPYQPTFPDIPRHLIRHRLDERSVAMPPRLPGEPGQLDQMHPVRRLQPLRLGPPHLPRRSEAGDQDHIRTGTDHLD
jgi:hypothetical protein